MTFVEMLVIVCACAYHWQLHPLATVIELLLQAAAGLRHLHACGIVHCDFRSENVLVESRDPLVVKIGDFGLAQGPARRLDRGANLGFWCGTYAAYVGWEDGVLSRWAAPEEIASVDHAAIHFLAAPASDMYQFGGFMFEVLTGGKKPFFWVPRDVGRWVTKVVSVHTG